VSQGSISYYKIQLLHNLFKRRTKGHCNHYILAPSTFYPIEAGRTRLQQSANIPSAHHPLMYLNLLNSLNLNRFMTDFHKLSSATSPARQAAHQDADSTNCFSLSPRNSMQWIPLLPKEGGLIQVDIGGHPPFPNGSKQFSGNFGNLLFLAGFNFWGHFEGPNEGFSRSRFSMIVERHD
jgi:hypothetical protein